MTELETNINCAVTNAYYNFMNGMTPIGYTLGILAAYLHVCNAMGFMDTIKTIEQYIARIRQENVSIGGFKVYGDFGTV